MVAAVRYTSSALAAARAGPAAAMADTVAPRWGKSDPNTAASSIAITVPLAIILSVVVLCMGWWFAPSEVNGRKTIGRMRTKPVFHTQAVYASASPPIIEAAQSTL